MFLEAGLSNLVHVSAALLKGTILKYQPDYQQREYCCFVKGLGSS